jgi:hypothetical protein
MSEATEDAVYTHLYGARRGTRPAAAASEADDGY